MPEVTICLPLRGAPRGLYSSLGEMPYNMYHVQDAMMGLPFLPPK